MKETPALLQCTPAVLGCQWLRAVTRPASRGKSASTRTSDDLSSEVGIKVSFAVGSRLTNTTLRVQHVAASSGDSNRKESQVQCTYTFHVCIGGASRSSTENGTNVVSCDGGDSA